MTCIVTSTYRYKRPPRKRKVVALEGPAVVTTKSSRRLVWGKTAAEVMMLLAPTPVREGAVQPSTPREAARVIAPPPANDDRKPAITSRRKPERVLPPGLLPDTPEEHQRRGGAAAR